MVVLLSTALTLELERLRFLQHERLRHTLPADDARLRSWSELQKRSVFGDSLAVFKARLINWCYLLRRSSLLTRMRQ